MNSKTLFCALSLGTFALAEPATTAACQGCWTRKTSGTCGSAGDIPDKAECQAAAAFVNQGDTTAERENHWGKNKGCFVKWNSKLLYNRHTQASRPCGLFMPCICRSDQCSQCPGKSWNRWTKKTSETCDTGSSTMSVVNKAECEEAAAFVEHQDTVAATVEHSAWHKGCYVYKNNNLYHNTHGRASRACSPTAPCICRVTYDGLCSNGNAIAMALRTQDGHCGSCKPGYDLTGKTCTAKPTVLASTAGTTSQITGFSTVNQQGSFPYLHGGGQFNKKPSEEACSNQCLVDPDCKYGTFVTASQSVDAATHAFGHMVRFGECWLAAQTHAVPVACGVACKSFRKIHQDDTKPPTAAPNTMGRECTCDPTDQPSTYMSCMATCDAHGLFHHAKAACTCDPAADRSSYTTCTQDPFSYHLKVQHLQPRFHTHALTGGERHRCKMVDANDCKCCDCADDGSFDSIREIGFGVHTAAYPFLSESVVADAGACRTLCEANPACKAGTYISSGPTAGTCIISANVAAAQNCEYACESFIKLLTPYDGSSAFTNKVWCGANSGRINTAEHCQAAAGKQGYDFAGVGTGPKYLTGCIIEFGKAFFIPLTSTGNMGGATNEFLCDKRPGASYFSGGQCGGSGCGPGGGGIITTEQGCKDAAAAYGKPYQKAAGTNWYAGCIVHGGKAYFVPLKAGHTCDKKDAHQKMSNQGYLCMN